VTKYAIQIKGLVGGGIPEGMVAGLMDQYVVKYDPDGPEGVLLLTSPDVGEALLFDSGTDAYRLWRMQSVTRPLRDDGRPNRPLTALTVLIDQVEVEPVNS
jgi:hypothetical protein